MYLLVSNNNHLLELELFFAIPKSDIIESVDSISKDERGFPLTQYITNGRISRGGYITQ